MPTLLHTVGYISKPEKARLKELGGIEISVKLHNRKEPSPGLCFPTEKGLTLFKLKSKSKFKSEVLMSGNSVIIKKTALSSAIFKSEKYITLYTRGIFDNPPYFFKDLNTSDVYVAFHSQEDADKFTFEEEAFLLKTLDPRMFNKAMAAYKRKQTKGAEVSFGDAIKQLQEEQASESEKERRAEEELWEDLLGFKKFKKTSK